jgi:SET domain
MMVKIEAALPIILAAVVTVSITDAFLLLEVGSSSKHRNSYSWISPQQLLLSQSIGVSTYASSIGVTNDSSSSSNNNNNNNNDNNRLEELCQLLEITLESSLSLLEKEDAVRGLFVTTMVKKGDLIVKIPLDTACLRDDQPPEWYVAALQDNKDNNNKNNDDDDKDSSVPYYCNNPSSDDWATRLAACVLDLQLKKLTSSCSTTSSISSSQPGGITSTTTTTQQGKNLWLSFLPPDNYLRASLPIHWSDHVLQSARCTALELAVDNAFFARAEPTSRLLQAFQQHYCNVVAKNGAEISHDQWMRMCHNAFDVVQTRSCRAVREVVVEEEEEEGNKYPVLRVLAPVFDLINHGSSAGKGKGSANAKFAVEDHPEVSHSDNNNNNNNNNTRPYLCVRAIRDLSAEDEVLIDYGDSAKPAWKCLISYGFVPQGRGVDSDDYDDEDEENNEEDFAEVYLSGRRYEVGPSTIPLDMVAAFTTNLDTAAAASTDEEDAEPILTPEIALKLAKRISVVSYYLLVDDMERSWNTDKLSSSDSDDLDTVENAEEILALRAARSLRWSQHRILRACAKGLQDWANRC